jgi:HAD superfamily hydrolase (TIGR01549 family)
VALVEVVTFDVWETLIHDSADSEPARLALRADNMANVLRRHGLPIAPAALVHAYRVARPAMESIWNAHRDFDTAEQIRLIFKLSPDLASHVLGATELAELAQAYARPLFDMPPTLEPDVPDVLAELARRGVRAAIICNTGRTPGWALRELFERFRIFSSFEVATFSNEERIRKPDPAIFRRTLERLGVGPSVALHIGDDPNTDVLGAKSIGMRAVMVRTPAFSLNRHEPTVWPDAQVGRLAELPALLDSWR